MMLKIGVVGAGKMGCGIAHVSSLAEYNVLLFDVSETQLKNGLAKIRKNLQRQVVKNVMTDAALEAAVGRIETTIDLHDFSDCDVIIEAVPEIEDLKLELFRQLDAIAAPETILTSNTSSISITRLAAVTRRPDQVVGMHFMNPVPRMQVVEVIRSLTTSDRVFAATVELAKSLGKEVAVAQDYPGFIVNRILIPMLNEAMFALFEGVGSVEDIDKALTLGAGQPMGPLTLADFIGLDTVLAIMNVLQGGYGDPKYRPCPLLITMVAAGRLGQKSGQGFYSYN
ncbi:MAG: 3-hydroxyacyl-CoA dehydrogenase NAD-binding domain-containing protein [Desulfuromonadales bacterium]|nr:3-hydroxyacyl-CoA dehydrogenase NAD-binding domain-containing protein [Desulfuromonadales bacterium]